MYSKLSMRADGLLQEDTTAYSLKCNISIDINDLAAGMRLALKDDREKRCALMCMISTILCFYRIVLKHWHFVLR